MAKKEKAQEDSVRAITASGMTPGIMKKHRPAPGDPNRVEKGKDLYKAWVEALKKR